MKLDKKRRRERRTDYHKRLILLKGKTPRLVIRKTNKYLILQIVESKNAQDRILYSANTKELLNKGWPEDKKGSLKSLSAAYLTGYLLGKKLKQEIKVILDKGLIPSTKGSRIYAAVKGISDSGINIKYNKKIIPLEDKIHGENTKINKEIFNKIRSSMK